MKTELLRKTNDLGDLMDRNTMIVLIVAFLVILVVIVIFAWIWIYTPYMGGYHHMGPYMNWNY